jgi:hypothetical protein
MGLTGLRKLKSIDRDHLVGREAVVQLANLDIFNVHTGLGDSSAGCMARHAEAHQINCAGVVELVGIGGHSLASDQNGLILQVWAGIKELLGDNDGSGTTIRGRAALKLGEGLKDHGCLHHLLEAVFVLELRIGVTFGVLMVDAGDFSEILVLCAVSKESRY